MGSKVIRNITKVFRSASGVLFGRSTAGTGRGEELTPSQVRSLLSVYTVTQTDTAISTAVNALIGGSPGLLDTLDELAAALGDDANFATTVTNALAGKVDSSSLSESIDDRVAALLVAGTNITLTYNDASNTLTIASTGSSGIGGSTGSTDNRVLRADGAGGSTLQSSAVTIDDSGNVTGVAALTTSGKLTLNGSGFVCDAGSVGYLRGRALVAFQTDIDYTIAGVKTSGAVEAVAITASGLMCVGVYTFATVPSASSNTGKFLRISDRSQKHAYSDGTNWRFFGDDAIIS